MSDPVTPAPGGPETQSFATLSYEAEIHSLLYVARGVIADLKGIFERDLRSATLSKTERRVTKQCVANFETDLARIEAALPLALERRDAAASRGSARPAATPSDTDRMNWLEQRAEENEHVEINFTDAWSESGDYGSILSSGPREFWLYDNGLENGPTLRDALDNAMRADAGDAEPGEGARTPTETER